MKEHMEVPLDTSNMSEQELQFHYFKVSFCFFSSLNSWPRVFLVYMCRPVLQISYNLAGSVQQLGIVTKQNSVVIVILPAEVLLRNQTEKWRNVGFYSACGLR